MVMFCPIPPDPQPPAELVELCEKANRDFLIGTDCVCEPYLYKGEWDDWKVRLVKRQSRAVVLDYITERGVDGHTLYLFVDKLKRQRELDLEEGMKIAMSRLTDHLCESVGINHRHFREHYNPTPKPPKQ